MFMWANRVPTEIAAGAQGGWFMDHNCRVMVDHIIRALFVLQPVDALARMQVVTRFLTEQVCPMHRMYRKPVDTNRCAWYGTGVC